MTHQTFQGKWEAIGASAATHDESSLFVAPGDVPRTQRQLNLHQYFLFVDRVLGEAGARDVLEMGCGRGTLALYLAEYRGLALSLMDSEAPAIAIAQRAFAARGLDARFYVGDATASGLPAASFDAVVSIGLAEHLDDVTAFFREQHRLLRPGGVVVSLNIPAKISVQHLNLILRAAKKAVGRYTEPIRKDYYRNAYSAAQYAGFARAAGLEEVRVVHVCPFPVYVPVGAATDRRLTTLRRAVLRARARWMDYPFKTNALMAQAHFLVARKLARG